MAPVKPRGGEVYLYQAKEDPDTKKGRLSFNNQVKTKLVFKSLLLTYVLLATGRFYIYQISINLYKQISIYMQTIGGAINTIQMD